MFAEREKFQILEGSTTHSKSYELPCQGFRSGDRQIFGCLVPWELNII